MRLEERQIEIRAFLSRATTMQAWVWQDFAVHRCLDLPDVWQITLLPTGMCFAIDWCGFDQLENAIAAMKEFAALRNDWHVIRRVDLNLALEAKMKAIALKHRAPARPEVGAAGVLDRDRMGRVVKARPNGYGAALEL